MSIRLKKYYTACVFFTLVVVLLFREETRAKTRKYAVEVENVQQCSEREYADVETPMRDLKIHKLNRTMRVFDMDYVVKRPWDADVGFKMELEIWGYAGWTPVPFVPITPDFCNTFKTRLPDVFEQILSNSFTKHDCPIPKGHYVWKNHSLDCSLSGKYFPFKGRFKVRFVLMSIKTKRLIFCITALMNVEEDLWTKQA